MLFPEQIPIYHGILYKNRRNIVDNIGKVFGKWKIKELIGTHKKNGRIYLAECECGFQKQHPLTNLKTKKTTQCKSCSMNNLNKTENLTGQQFGKWFVVEKIKNNQRNEWFYKCKCVCGTLRNIAGSNLKKKETTQCHRCRNKTHGMSYTDTFRIWSGILRRCFNKNFKAYPRYGGRGITVCDRWLKFENFFNDMGSRPEGLQIDRIDNDGNYEPKNCRWVTSKENNLNRTIPIKKRK